MRPWVCKTMGVSSGLIGLLLLGLVARATYFTDHGAETTLFMLGLPLLMFCAIGGVLLLRCAARLLGLGIEPWSIAKPRPTRHA